MQGVGGQAHLPVPVLALTVLKISEQVHCVRATTCPWHWAATSNSTAPRPVRRSTPSTRKPCVSGGGAAQETAEVGGRPVVNGDVWDEKALHTATELFYDPSAIGPDFVSHSEGHTCDMCTRTLWPLCGAKVKEECFDIETKQVRRQDLAGQCGGNITVFTKIAAAPARAHKKTVKWD
ncbi:hypothetical protein BDV11DRAFT_166990 [Aspergillus similis]